MAPIVAASVAQNVAYDQRRAAGPGWPASMHRVRAVRADRCCLKGGWG
jgi:hypothetical protein